MLQYYKIAGLTVRMDTFGRTLEQAEPYLCPEQASVDMEIQIPEIDNETLHKEQPHLSLAECEYINTGRAFYSCLLDFNALMLHACAVVVDGKAYLFSAASGTGKSTHVNLWLKLFGDRAVILNDDKPTLRLEDGVWYAYGTPWSGKYDISSNQRVPLAGIAMIERSETNEIEPFTGSKAVFQILGQTLRPRGTRHRMVLLELMDKLMAQVPVWKLRCNMDPEAAIVSYEAMSGMKKENG
ncbi:MAG: hypothetical protein E7437_02030 [Ruminococcaceae bacterium]|nr:hypothetical protein [Oscillospiraceae bacterium]